jgi:hypothetical protein
MSTEQTPPTAPVDAVVRQHFVEEIDGVVFAEEWANSHKERLGGYQSSIEWIELADGKDGRVLAYWFNSQMVGTATVLRDEFNETEVLAVMTV